MNEITTVWVGMGRGLPCAVLKRCPGSPAAHRRWYAIIPVRAAGLDIDL